MDGVMFFQLCIMIIEVGVAVLLLSAISRLNRVMAILSPIFDMLKGVSSEGGEKK